MRTLRSWLLRLGGLFNKLGRDRELAEELESNLELHIDENIRAGMPPEEARRDALIKLGGVEQVKESYRDRRGLPWLERFAQDVRFGLRVLRKNPGFTAVAVLTIALGIGANTAIFSVVNAVLLHQLPYRDPSRLVMVWEQNVTGTSGNKQASGPDLIDWREQNHVFDDMAFWPGWSGSDDFNLVGSDGVEKVSGSYVSSHIFPLLGVQPFLGRPFLAEDDQRHGNRTALISYSLWQRRFGSDPSALGRTITVDSYGRRDYTIIGVMPAGFRFPDRSEVWLPAGWIDPQLDQRRSGHWYSVIARLKPGVTLDRAASEMSLIQSRIAQDHPAETVGLQVALVPLLDQTLGARLRPALLALCGVVSCVLLIACANLSNLLLARNSARQGEIAVRLALGASRARLIRQLLTESVLLALAGAACGVLAAYEGLRIFVSIAGAYVPRLAEAKIDAGTLAFTLGLSLVAALVFGGLPAFQISRPDLNETLKGQSAKGNGAYRGSRLRSSLVVVEVAASLVLLAGAGLMVRSFVSLLEIDRGFQPDHLLTANLDFSVSGFTTWIQPTASRPQIVLQRLIDRVRQYPAVESVAASSRLPRDRGNSPPTTIVIEGRPVAPANSRPTADFEGITANYFKTMGIPLLQGRDFNESDSLDAPLVVIVDSALSQAYFPGENPIGKRLAFPSQQDPTQPNTFQGKVQWMQIVGVVANIKNLSLNAQSIPEFYEPYWQYPMQSPTLLVRTSAEPDTMIAAIRADTKSVAPNLPGPSFRTMDEILGDTVAEPRYETVIFALFGLTALILSSIGIYGVISYSVAQRTHEIGIRIALGATRGDVLGLTMREGLKLTLTGSLIGILGAVGLTRFLGSLLYGVKPNDPLTFIIVSLVLIAVAMLACYIPARRAVRVDPMVALRHE